MSLSLSSIQTGKQLDRPVKILLYSPEGCGKSTFCAGCPDPIMILTEDGASAIDVPKFPVANKFDEIIDAIGVLFSEEHNFKTVCLDSLTWCEVLAGKQICLENDISSIAAIPYGKGYADVTSKVVEILAGLDALFQHKKMNVVITAHSEVIEHQDPQLPDSYNRYTLRLDKRLRGRAIEWPDIVAFANFQTLLQDKGSGFKQSKHGVDFGKRSMYLVRSAGFDAKNRYGLPKEIPFDAAVFWKTYNETINPTTQLEEN